MRETLHKRSLPQLFLYRFYGSVILIVPEFISQEGNSAGDQADYHKQHTQVVSEPVVDIDEVLDTHRPASILFKVSFNEVGLEQ